MNWTFLLVLLIVAAIAAVAGAFIRSALQPGESKEDKNILRERILPNILTISTYVFIIAMVALAADIWAMWAVFASIEGMLDGVNAVVQDDGTTEITVDIALVTDFMGKVLNAFAFHTIAMTALTGLIMIMKDVATAPPSKSEVAELFDKFIDKFAIAMFGEPEVEVITEVEVTEDDE